MAKMKGDQDGQDQPAGKGRKARKLPPGMRKRGGTFYANFKRNGRWYQQKLSTDYRTAETMFHQLKARADLQTVGMTDNKVSLASIRDAYLRDMRGKKRPTYIDRVEACLSKVIGFTGAVNVSDLSIILITNFEEHRQREGVCGRTINMEVGALKTMLRWAVKHQLTGSHPIEAVRPQDHTPREGRAFTPDEIERLLTASPQPWRDVWYAYLVTGMRKMELASLQWRDIDTETREIIVRADVAKTKTARRIPIDAGLWEILERRRREPRAPGSGKTAAITKRVQERFTREHVFTTTANTPLTHRAAIYGAFVRCCKLAGIERVIVDSDGREQHLDVHSFRRTFATDLIRRGKDPKTVQVLMGHKTLTMTMGLYTKMNATDKRQAIDSLSYGRGVSTPEGVAGVVSLKSRRKIGQ
jgi:integrase